MTTYDKVASACIPVGDLTIKDDFLAIIARLVNVPTFKAGEILHTGACEHICSVAFNDTHNDYILTYNDHTRAFYLSGKGFALQCVAIVDAQGHLT